MATCINSSRVLFPSFLYHPYIPSFKSKDFSFTCILSTTVLCDPTVSIMWAVRDNWGRFWDIPGYLVQCHVYPTVSSGY